MLKEKDSNHEAQNENVPIWKKFWIGILLLTVIIIALGVFKTWVFAFLIVPIILSIVLLCKKQNKTDAKDLNIKSKSFTKETKVTGYNLLQSKNKDGYYLNQTNSNDKRQNTFSNE